MPLALSKWYIGQPDQDPKAQPIDVYITDSAGNKQLLAQPIETDAIGNFINAHDSNQEPIYPQIDQSTYSLIVEVDIQGQVQAYNWKSITAHIEDDGKYQQKSDLIDIQNIKPTDDLEHNAPTAKSVIDSFTVNLNGILRVPDLSDAIDSTDTDVPANSKAVNDLRVSLLEKITVFKYFRRFNTASTISLDLSNVTGIVRFVGKAGGGGGGSAIHIRTQSDNAIPSAPQSGQAGGMFDVLVDVTNINDLVCVIPAGGVGGDPDNDTDGSKGGNLEISDADLALPQALIATAFGGSGGEYGALWSNTSFPPQEYGGAAINMSSPHLISGTGIVGQSGQYGRLRMLPNQAPSNVVHVAARSANGGGQGFDGIGFNTGTSSGTAGRGGDSPRLLFTSDLNQKDSSGDAGTDGELLVFSNQQIPDPT